MSENPPTVYILNGDDEFAIAGFVTEIEQKMGDPGMAAMNTTRLDGRSLVLEDLQNAVGALPFMLRRRMVVVTAALERIKTPEQRKRFTQILEYTPATTALVLVENQFLTDYRDRGKGKLHWLETWAETQGKRVLLRTFALPRGGALIAWIQQKAKARGGGISLPAAQLLASLVGDDPRLADQELVKLMAYVNYKRQIEPEDVQALTVDVAHGDIFAMVDALGSGDGRKATGMLLRLLEEQDPFSIFGMVVRQFRLLLLAREVLDAGGNTGDVGRVLKTPSFVAEKMTAQARHFTLPVLETVYRRLLELDEMIKTSQIDSDLALHTFVATLTTPER